MSLKTDSRSLTPSDIRSAARKTALREIETQKEEFQQFGIMADWSKETMYRTLGSCIHPTPHKFFQRDF
ncbi:hypothetical protein F5146DRAFT_1038989 [Armillaria mellea]|nr:hypothetical protein F5146DRAFT_1038989 [Armillaria mellea]